MAGGTVILLMAGAIVVLTFGVLALWERIDDWLFWYRRRHKREEYKRFLSRYKDLPKKRHRAMIEIYECYKSWQESINK